QEVDDRVVRYFLLQEREKKVGGAHRGVDPQPVKNDPVSGVIDARDGSRHFELVFCHLADHEIVLVMTGDGDHHIGTFNSGRAERCSLRAVALKRGSVEDVDYVFGLGGLFLDNQDFLTLAEKRFGEIVADLAGANDDDVHYSPVTRPNRRWAPFTVGEMVSSPTEANISARTGSYTRAITLGTLSTRWATCAGRRFRLSPLVTQMATSAVSAPGALGAWTSMPLPRWVWPLK